jgi:steroid delta-isomerase-like uncharacterized protein
MSVEQNKAAVLRLHEMVNKGDYTKFHEIFAPDYVAHMGQEVKGPEGMRNLHITMRTAFPDFLETIEHMVAEGDMVSVSYTLSGTFKGEYAGNKPNGKKFAIPGSVLAHFKNGKQVEAWTYMDSLAWYQQLGISPPAAPR